MHIMTKSDNEHLQNQEVSAAVMSGAIVLPVMLVPRDPWWMENQPAGLKSFSVQQSMSADSFCCYWVFFCFGQLLKNIFNKKKII